MPACCEVIDITAQGVALEVSGSGLEIDTVNPTTVSSSGITDQVMVLTDDLVANLDFLSRYLALAAVTLSRAAH